MADTGAPWFIPFVEPTDIPRTYPQDSEDLADAIAAGLSAAGGLVAVSYADLKTASSGSVENNTTLDIITLSHSLSDPANKLMVFALANVSGAATGVSQIHESIEVTADGTLIGVGDAASNRTRAAAYGREDNLGNERMENYSIVFQYEPGTTASVEYKLRTRNLSGFTKTMYINRTSLDTDNLGFARGICTLTLMEVKV